MKDEPDPGERRANFVAERRKHVRFHFVQPTKTGDINEHERPPERCSILQNNRKYSWKKIDFLLVYTEKQCLLQIVEPVIRAGNRSVSQMFANLFRHRSPGTQRIH